MPGFKGKRVTFWFYSDKQGKVLPEQLRFAERICLNGGRIAAAVRDELEYFQKAVPKDHGDINNMHDILIEIGPKSMRSKGVGWLFRCRLPRGIRLAQHGYRVAFTDLKGWDLQVPFYLQPTPSEN